MIRRRAFRDPRTERNRVWQTDFSEFETSAGGIWRIRVVVDCATKYCLAVTISRTSRAADALACLHAAVAEAYRMLDLENLRADRGPVDVTDDSGEVIGQAPIPTRWCRTTRRR